MGMGQSTGRSSWRYACSDNGNWDLKGHAHGVEGGFMASRWRSIQIEIGEPWAQTARGNDIHIEWKRVTSIPPSIRLFPSKPSN